MNKLLKLHSPNCIPCKILTNYLVDKEVAFDDVDISVNSEAIEKYSLSSVPVLILLDENDQEIDRVSGLNPEATARLISQL